MITTLGSAPQQTIEVHTRLRSDCWREDNAQSGDARDHPVSCAQRLGKLRVIMWHWCKSADLWSPVPQEKVWALLSRHLGDAQIREVQRLWPPATGVSRVLVCERLFGGFELARQVEFGSALRLWERWRATARSFSSEWGYRRSATQPVARYAFACGHASR